MTPARGYGMVLWLICMGLGGALPAPGEEPANILVDTVTVSPERPVDSGRTWVVLEGGYRCFGPHGLRGWSLVAGTIRIEIEGVLGCFLAPPMYEPFHYEVDLGVLPAGTYSLEVWAYSSIGVDDPPFLDRRQNLTVLVSTPSVQGFVTIATLPAWPRDTAPLTLAISGDFSCGGRERLLGWQQFGDTLRIAVEGEPYCVSVASSNDPFAIAVDVGTLPAGNYSVEVWVDPGDQFLPPALVRETTVEVRRGVEISAPEVATSRDAFTVTVSGFGFCPPLVGEPEVDGHRVVIPYAVGICNPPDPADFRMDVVVDPLPPGTGIVELRHDFDGRNLIDRTEIQILQDPVELANGAFRVDVAWTTTTGESGRGRPVQPPSPDSALFWFFAPRNWELMVKVLDGCPINGHRWVFAAASTDVAYTLTVEDVASGETWTRSHPGGTAAPAITDTSAFVCD